MLAGEGSSDYTRKLLGVMNMKYIHYLDCGSGYIVYIHQNLSNSILKNVVYYVNYTSRKLFFKCM